MRFLKRSLLCLFSMIFLTACGSPPSSGKDKKFTANSQVLQNSLPSFSAEDVPQTPSGSFNPLVVYKDKGSRENHFTPSGFMPDGKCLAFNDKWMENCQTGKTCMKVEYDVQCSMEGQGWAGIYWLNPPNNWGKQKGGFDLGGAHKLTFWAKGDRGGERIEEFKIGGILGDYPDSDMAMIGPVILTNEWREYTIDLRGKDLSYISGGFLWSTRADENPEGCTFYLDDIVYE